MIPDVPEDPNAWTLDTIRGLLRNASYEPERYDWKAALNESKKSATSSGSVKLSESIGRAACAMANGYGGFLVFGVREPQEGDSGAEDRMVGIPMSGEPPKEFGDKVSAIRPGIQYEPALKLLQLPERTSHGVFVVRVPRSPLRPHMFTERFWKRVAGGKAEAMDVTEVREQMLNTEERVRKLELLRTRIAFLNQTYHEIKGEGDENLRTIRFDASGLPELVSDTCAAFPPDKKLEEGLMALLLAANHANGLMDRLYAWSGSGGIDPGIASKWRIRANERLDEVVKRTKECGAIVKAVLDGLRTVHSTAAGAV